MEGVSGQYYKDAGGAFTSIVLSPWEGQLQESQETGVVAQGTGSGKGKRNGKINLPQLLCLEKNPGTEIVRTVPDLPVQSSAEAQVRSEGNW